MRYPFRTQGSDGEYMMADRGRRTRAPIEKLPVARARFDISDPVSGYGFSFLQLACAGKAGSGTGTGSRIRSTPAPKKSGAVTANPPDTNLEPASDGHRTGGAN